MRVLVSGLKGGVAMSGNGSAFNVTDSKAIALVEVAWLSKIGFLLVAAWTVVKLVARTILNRRTAEVKKAFDAQHGRQLLIMDRLRHIFRNKYRFV
jgi:hypothetical protein